MATSGSSGMTTGAVRGVTGSRAAGHQGSIGRVGGRSTPPHTVNAGRGGEGGHPANKKSDKKENGGYPMSIYPHLDPPLPFGDG